MLAYCKSVYTGSIPVPASNKINDLDCYLPQKYPKNLIHNSYTVLRQLFACFIVNIQFEKLPHFIHTKSMISTYKT